VLGLKPSKEGKLTAMESVVTFRGRHRDGGKVEMGKEKTVTGDRLIREKVGVQLPTEIAGYVGGGRLGKAMRKR